MGPINPETLATFGNRLATNRNSAYSPPGWAEGVLSGLPSFDVRHCSSGIGASLDPETVNRPAFRERTKKGETKEAEEFLNALKQYAFGGQSGTSATLAPGCTQQAPFNPIYGSGPATTYQQTFEQPGG